MFKPVALAVHHASTAELLFALTESQFPIDPKIDDALISALLRKDLNDSPNLRSTVNVLIRWHTDNVAGLATNQDEEHLVRICRVTRAFGFLASSPEVRAPISLIESDLNQMVDRLDLPLKLRVQAFKSSMGIVRSRGYEDRLADTLLPFAHKTLELMQVSGNEELVGKLFTALGKVGPDGFEAIARTYLSAHARLDDRTIIPNYLASWSTCLNDWLCDQTARALTRKPGDIALGESATQFVYSVLSGFGVSNTIGIVKIEDWYSKENRAQFDLSFYGAFGIVSRGAFGISHLLQRSKNMEAAIMLSPQLVAGALLGVPKISPNHKIRQHFRDLAQTAISSIPQLSAQKVHHEKDIYLLEAVAKYFLGPDLN